MTRRCGISYPHVRPGEEIRIGEELLQLFRKTSKEVENNVEVFGYERSLRIFRKEWAEGLAELEKRYGKRLLRRVLNNFGFKQKY